MNGSKNKFMELAIALSEKSVAAKRIGFDDSFIYDQIPLAPSRRTVPSEEMMRAEALQAFRLWERKEDKVEY